MRKRIITMLSVIILLLQSSLVSVQAAYITLKVHITSGDKTKDVVDSSIFYTYTGSGTFTVDIDTDCTDVVLTISDKNGKMLNNGNSLTAEFEEPGTYYVSAKSASGKVYKKLTIDVHPATEATTGTRYRTQTFVCTHIDGKPVPTTWYRVEIGGQEDIPKDQWEIIDGWPDGKGGRIIPRDGKTHELKGFGMIKVSVDGVDKQSYSTYQGGSNPAFKDFPRQLSDLQRAYGWSEKTKKDFESRSEMTLSYTAAFPARVVSQVFYDGEGSEVRDDIEPEEPIWPSETSKATVNATPKDAGWELDTDRSRYWVGTRIDNNPWALEGGANYHKLSVNDIKKTFTLAYNSYTVIANYYYKKADLPNGTFTFDATPNDLQVVKAEASTLGQAVDLNISLKQPSDMLSKWEKVLNEPGIQASVTITRNPDQENISTIASPFPPGGAYTGSDKATLMKLLKGETSLKFRDDTISYPIEPDQTVELTYTASVKIKVGSKEVVLSSKKDTDTVRFYRPPLPPPQKGYYTSSPSYWSEIKEGSPLNETFEAMAGVPTTRNLYFASGGSEFIVDIETEYVPNGTATRSYTDTFTSVKCDKWKCAPDCHGHSTGGPNPTTYYCGGCCHCPCHHHEVSDSWDWSQSVTFDYMKINNAKVWKLDRSKVDGMMTLLGTDEVTADIEQGNPTIFYNIAGDNNTSASGRLRYSLNTDQHDHASWTQASNNSCTGHTAANMAVMNSHKNLTTSVTAASDFLILQTTRGDQSVLYFDKTSPARKTYEPLEVPKTSKEAMWENNGNSAANWSESHINIGSYNGQYQSPSAKYESGGGPTVSTVFDSMPAGLNRPSRPSGGLRLVRTNLDIIDTLPNKEYITGTSTVFYQNILNYGSGSTRYSLAYNARYGSYGQEFVSAYSPIHSKVNDIVIHNPVSTELAMILPLPADRDQRSAGSVIGHARQPDDKCTGDPADCEFRILDCRFSGGTSHTVACYATIVNHGSYETHIHNASCGLINAVTYLCNNLPLNTGGVGYWHHDSGCSYEGETHQTTSTSKCTTCGHSCGYLQRAPSPASHTHNASCASYTTQKWNCNNLPLNSKSSNNVHVHTGACHHITTPLSYSCNNLPLNTGGTGRWYHSSGCTYAGETHTTTSNSSCTQCGHSCGYLETAVAPATHTHTGFCTTIPAQDYWDCGGHPLNQHVCTPNCTNVSVLNCVEPHHMGMHYDVGNTICYRACMDDSKHAAKPNISVPGLGAFTPGKFINLDYGFTVYFPNMGDFYGDGDLGLGRTTAQRGRGYVNSMDTTEWTKEKSVYFDFNVIFNGKMYRSGEKVPLDVQDPDGEYEFYCPLGNAEWVDAKVRYECIAINNPTGQIDNAKMTNRLRDWYLEARHSGIKNTTIDVVGKIGNLVIEDTGDFRFSNLFKIPNAPVEWFMPNLVAKVNNSLQNRIFGDTFDIRGNPVSAATCYLDTYGFLPHKRQVPIPFPLSPEKNNIPALQKQPLRMGYMVYSDVETIGDYRDNMQIIMYYYYLDLVSGAIQPVDIYMNVNNQYKPINLHGAAVPGWDPNSIHNHVTALDWEDEYLRRNYSIEEKLGTEQISSILDLKMPGGRYYEYGNSQVLFLTERNRTFIGNTSTYGDDKNPGSRIDSFLYNQQAQRWHFTYGLPSSAVAVRKGQAPTQANIDALRNNNGVILAAADILSVGKVFNLQYKFKSGNNPVVIGGTSYRTNSIPYPVVAVYSASRSSADDLQITGTH